MKKSYFQIIINFSITLLHFCFGSCCIGYKGFDCMKGKIESVLSKEILMLCIVFIYRKEISEENNLLIFINCITILQQAEVLNSLKK